MNEPEHPVRQGEQVAIHGVFLCVRERRTGTRCLFMVESVQSPWVYGF
jgi:hypothetical protein